MILTCLAIIIIALVGFAIEDEYHYRRATEEGAEAIRPAVPIFGANTPPDNGGEWITGAAARALTERLFASGPTPDRFERSTPLRPEADRDDTMGAGTDPDLEMGEAETWFRDQLESEP